ncbi:hypothetical protein FIU86_21820 (plasmid) [Roseovarius sp. THAF9]|uniref:glutathione S-transferase family protein n=1 Tax=Roseovarius sp. THAF9 TaxID=2587847 RepID=UPI0012682057|nr:glutathione S-transferase family protein [Roseovarius sp. THAF9]QFT95507.1 hypothetical protein FIU86_21820 [Roseovarius sp. THAF9]
MVDLILHHYEASPYSEKIRTLMGFKGLSWSSVIVPPIAPKADLLALTGGYRRAPVLQIGADIYCDSALIAAELDQRFPARALAPNTAGTATPLLDNWADRILFWQVVRYSMGLRADAVPPALIHDREAFWDHKIDLDGLKADVRYHRGQITTGLGWLENLLGGADFFAGDTPALTDLALYHVVWFFAKADTTASGSGLSPFPALSAWMARIAEFGHGTRTELAPAEAIMIAVSATPAPLPATGLAHPAIGASVQVLVDEFGTEVIDGTLAHIDDTRIILHRDTPQVGTVAVHFPRHGYPLRTTSIQGENT